MQQLSGSSHLSSLKLENKHQNKTFTEKRVHCYTISSHHYLHTMTSYKSFIVKDIFTSESPVYNVDSSVQQIAASLLNGADNFYLDPALLNGRGWTSELRPRLHSESLRVHSQKVYSKIFHVKSSG